MTRDSRLACDGLDNLLRPIRIEANRIDIHDENDLIAVGKGESGRVKRQVGAETTLMRLRTPSALGRARAGGYVGSSNSCPKMIQCSLLLRIAGSNR